MNKLLLSIFVGVAFSALNVSAKPAGCPCSPCTCGACTCGGGGGSSSKGGSHHADHHGDHHGDKHGDHHGDHHGGSSVGVGVNVDLSGIGHRNAEPDPFAAGGAPPTRTAVHTEEKHETPNEHRDAHNPYDEIKLTGPDAKDQSASNP